MAHYIQVPRYSFYDKEDNDPDVVTIGFKKAENSIIATEDGSINAESLREEWTEADNNIIGVMATKASITDMNTKLSIEDAAATYDSIADVDNKLTNKLSITDAESTYTKQTYAESTYTKKTETGDLDTLTTTAKSTIVAAINEIDSNTDAADTKIGDMTSLSTTSKDTLVGAINEVDANADAVTTAVGDVTTVNAQYKGTDLVGSVNNIVTDVSANKTNIGTMTDLETTEKSTLVGAINEVKTEADTNKTAIGTLADLDTQAKSDLVSSINEVIDLMADCAGTMQVSVDVEPTEFIIPPAVSMNKLTSTGAFNGNVMYNGELKAVVKYDIPANKSGTYKLTVDTSGPIFVYKDLTAGSGYTYTVEASATDKSIEIEVGTEATSLVVTAYRGFIDEDNGTIIASNTEAWIFPQSKWYYDETNGVIEDETFSGQIRDVEYWSKQLNKRFDVGESMLSVVKSVGVTSRVGNAALETESDNLSDAINELDDDIDSIVSDLRKIALVLGYSSGKVSYTNPVKYDNDNKNLTVNGAIDVIKGHIESIENSVGTLANLTTDNKENLVSALNEIVTDLAAVEEDIDDLETDVDSLTEDIEDIQTLVKCSGNPWVGLTRNTSIKTYTHASDNTDAYTISEIFANCPITKSDNSVTFPTNAAFTIDMTKAPSYSKGISMTVYGCAQPVTSGSYPTINQIGMHGSWLYRVDGTKLILEDCAYFETETTGVEGSSSYGQHGIFRNIFTYTADLYILSTVKLDGTKIVYDATNKCIKYEALSVGTSDCKFVFDISSMSNTCLSNTSYRVVSTVTAYDNANTALDRIGSLANLNTTDKSSVVAAVNEVTSSVHRSDSIVSNVDYLTGPMSPYLGILLNMAIKNADANEILISTVYTAFTVNGSILDTFSSGIKTYMRGFGFSTGSGWCGGKFWLSVANSSKTILTNASADIASSALRNVITPIYLYRYTSNTTLELVMTASPYVIKSTNCYIDCGCYIPPTKSATYWLISTVNLLDERISNLLIDRDSDTISFSTSESIAYPYVNGENDDHDDNVTEYMSAYFA